MGKTRRIILSLLLEAGFLGLGIAPVFGYNYGAGEYGICAYGGSCSISLTASDTINLPLAPSPGGVYTIQSDSVTVTTGSPTGYSVSLESSSASSAALVSGTSSLPASSGTSNAPTALALNTWGYRVDNQEGFGTGPTSAVTNATTSSLPFAGLTLSGNPQEIYISGSPAPSGNLFHVWYGIRADATVTPGTYQQTVVYTATVTP